LNPGAGEIFRTCPHRPWSPPSHLYNAYRVFPGGKERPGRTDDPLTPFQCRGQETVELYLYPLSGPHRTCNGKTSTFLHTSGGPGSSFGIVTDLGLDGPGIESRCGARFSAPVQTGPGARPVSCTMGTGSFTWVNSGRGVTRTPHPLLVPWSRKSKAIPLLPLWGVRPVQSLSACTRVHFTFTFTTNNP